ncbi:hypothetical protein LCGC14_0358860 [marine sediment metagenome]|uniref:Uncharacterized protein n=1 Tax=marine sediment metagenome TaxID=412755 RepID=A0A0F9VVY0_9ZZZZ
MSKKKKPTIIKDTPEDFVYDHSLQNHIIQHVNVYGFCDIVPNAIEAYRTRARRLNRHADALEKMYKRSIIEMT